MKKGTINYVKRPEGKRPGGCYLKEVKEQWFTVWDFKGKQKGDVVLYEETDSKTYNGKLQVTIAISDDVPSTDVNADIQPDLLSGAEVVSHKDFTNTSIESQVIEKEVCATDREFYVKNGKPLDEDEFEKMTDRYIEAFLRIKKRLSAPVEPTFDERYSSEPIFDAEGRPLS